MTSNIAYSNFPIIPVYIGDSKPTFPAESDNKQSVSISTQQQAVRSEQSISVPIHLSRFEGNRIGSSFVTPLRHDTRVTVDASRNNQESSESSNEESDITLVLPSV